MRTLDGDVSVKIPAGSSSGRRIRLRGKGYPQTSGSPSGGARGDLFAEIRIAIPTEIGPEERELYERLAEISDFRPRGD